MISAIKITSEEIDEIACAIDAFILDKGYWRITPVIGEKKIIVPTRLKLTNLAMFKKIYFFQIGKNDELPWIFFGQNEDNLLVYFEADCDFTGFDCQGGGIIIIAIFLKQMLTYGLTKNIYDKIVKKSNKNISISEMIYHSKYPEQYIRSRKIKDIYIPMKSPLPCLENDTDDDTDDALDIDNILLHQNDISILAIDDEKKHKKITHVLNNIALGILAVGSGILYVYFVCKI